LYDRPSVADAANGSAASRPRASREVFIFGDTFLFFGFVRQQWRGKSLLATGVNYPLVTRISPEYQTEQYINAAA
jgi:hypothetical protein